MLSKKQQNKLYRIKERKLALFKLGNQCVHCKTRDLDVLQFDHINPIRRKNDNLRRDSGDNLVRKIMKANFKEVSQEIQILCANCHMKKSNQENSAGFSSDETIRDEVEKNGLQLDWLEDVT